MADESLREIQLDGKQLVFLFMAATVVAVVIFLSGVMVGRGVRPAVAAAVESTADVVADPTAPASTSTSGVTASTASPATNETLTYPNRLEGDEPPPESLEDVPDPTAPVTRQSETRATTGQQPAARPAASRPAAAATPAAAVSAAARPAAAATPAVAASAAVRPALAEPAGSGFVVQVAATKQKSEADTIAKRLANKGYPAFVTTPPSGPQMYRVRVGKYPDRKEADRVATRLQREEQFKPWVTR